MNETKTGKITEWLNRRTANFLRDYKTQPDPADHPNKTCRGICRFQFIIVLSVASALSLGFIILNAPDVRSFRLTNLQDAKHYNYTLRNVYNRSNQYDSEKNDIVSCPCNTKAFSWKNFTTFYILNENSTEWNITYNSTPPISISLPSRNDSFKIFKLPTHIQRNQSPATSDMFCKIAGLWPDDANTTACNTPVNVNVTGACSSMCDMMSSALLLPSNIKYYNDTIETLMESPFLLSREVLFILVVQRARELLLRTRERVSALDTNPTANIYNNAVTVFLLNVLRSYDVEEWQSYYNGAHYQSTALGTLVNYSPAPDCKVLVLNNIVGIAFLHMDINWMTYYNTCNPHYCEITTPTNILRKVYWAFALLGGSTTVVLGIVNIVVWPAVAYVLSLWPGTSSDASLETSTKISPENEVSDLLPPGERSEESEMVSMPIAPGSLPLQTPQRTKSTRPMDRMVSRGRETFGPEDL